MSLYIFYTPRSTETFQSVHDFINNKFGVNAADNFISKTEKIVTLISDHPLMFKASAIDKNVRIALITKQTSLFYRVTDNSIHLLFFWDNRQQPFMI
jgi:plasmid stabilization system protein ParE